MFENWIKFEKLTLEKPEVYQMAAILKIDVHSVVGKLLTVWTWFDDHTEDGTAPVSVIPLLDGKTCKGFCAAMQDPTVRWLKVEAGMVSICNYEKHNGVSAKKRANDQRRKQKSRSNTDFCHTNIVTNRGQVSHQYCDKSRTDVRFVSQLLRTFVTLARSSQFSFSFFLYQGEEFSKYSVLEGQAGTEVQYAA